MLQFKLHAKFLVFILGGAVVLLGLLAATIIQRESRILIQKESEQQRLLVQTVVANLKNNMIEGRPRSTLKLIAGLQETPGLVRLNVLRRDGVPAFGKTGARFNLPHLQRAVTTGEEVVFQEHGAVPLHTVLVPLKNGPACIGCHARSGNILGVILLSLSREDAVRELAQSKRNLTIVLVAFILIIGSLLYITIRQIVLKPLAILHSGAELIGAGNLSHRIPLRTNDEFSGLARAFNEMSGRLKASHSDHEHKIQERTAQLHDAMAELEVKADTLSAYSRDLSTVSWLSVTAFNDELSLDELLDDFIGGLAAGLGYQRAMLCIVDRKSGRLEVKRSTGMDELLHFHGGPLTGSDPFIKLVRTARVTVIDDITKNTPPYIHGSGLPGPLSLFIMPILSHSYNKRCWELTSCINTDCPARNNEGEYCWLVENTLCGDSLKKSCVDKLSRCVTCKVFPVVGVLAVAADRQKQPLRGMSINVLRILAAEMGAAIENHRLHDLNQQTLRNILALHRVTADALSGLSIDKALDIFTDSALKFSGLDACNFWLVSEDGHELVHRAGGCATSNNDDHCPGRLPADQGLLGTAFAENRLIVDYNVMLNDDTDLARSIAAHGLNSLLAIPLHAEGSTLGVFSVHKESYIPFLESEMASFMLLANQAAMLINVCRLNEELKAQNRDIARSEGLLGGILASMSSGVILLDMTGAVRLVNIHGAGILRRDQDELIGLRLTDLFPETDAFISSAPGAYREIDIKMPDGAIVPIWFSKTYHLGEDRKDEGVIIVFRDLTELKALQAELLDKERFAAMGRVVAGVAHEIRNPLFGISAIGQIFERDLTSNAQRELSRALVSETRRLNQLVEELLIYGRPMKLNSEPCDLQQLWEEVISMHQGELEKKGITVTGDYAVRHPVLRLDVHQIRQVFLNLLRNSLDATPAGGRIIIRLLLDDRHILFKINDTGAGIHANNIGRVFDLFFTTKPKGTGLGLAICKKILQDHGGDVSIESEVGSGTTVTVRLPYKGMTEKRET